MSTLSRLQEQLGHRFSDPGLLRQALTHRSVERDHNERLEFLGDAVLGAVIAETLYRRFPDASEGDLSRLRASLVNRDTLAGLALELSLDRLLRLGTGERKSGGARRPAMLCDAFEAVLGALYLDAGETQCRRIIQQLFEPRLAGTRQWQDPKTRLQELMQAAGVSLPAYDIVSIDGEEHEQTFIVRCHVPLLEQQTTGRGRTRQQAEREAAAQALQRLESDQVAEQAR